MAVMDHVRFLSEKIGPRGSTTDKEREAAQYVTRVLKDSGLEATTENFLSAKSVWYPYVLYSSLLIFSEVVFLVGGRLGSTIATLVSGISLLSVLQELTFKQNLFRWLLPKAPSQNVWAKIEPRKEKLGQIVLLGHLDTHRTPLVFSTDRWLKFFKVLVPIGLVSSVLLLLIFIGSIFLADDFWRPLSIPFAAFITVLFLVTLQADLSPYTVGANDNASGVSIALSLADRLSKKPLDHTSVWVVLSGCEEVGCYGADAFAKARGDELDGACWLTLDNLGSKGGNVCYLTKETFLLTARSDIELVRLAGLVANRHPELGVHSHSRFSGAFTEGSIGAKYGFKVLTLISLSHKGSPTDWHRPTDVIDRVDTIVVEDGEKFAWELLKEIDRNTVRDGRSGP